jgi:2,5-diamino-6-(ribosylamino)-4(3H)-pyrimidinone 5'-phosphate reductase
MNSTRTRPYTLLISEVTADGKLTLAQGISSKRLMKFMSHESEVMLHECRAMVDAIMVGANTIRIDNSCLTVRLATGKNPLRVIPSSSGNLPLTSNIFNGDAATLVAVSQDAPSERIEQLKQHGADVVITGAHEVDISDLMNILYSRFNIRYLMVEGGSHLIGTLFSHNLIDEVRLIHLPFIVGGENTPSLVSGFSAGDENGMIRLELKKYAMYGENLVTEYTITRT